MKSQWRFCDRSRLMNKLLLRFLDFKKFVMMYDWERKALIHMIEHCVSEKGNTARLLDVGCGYGRNLNTAKNICGICIGVDINPEIVQANKEKGFECYLPETLPRDVKFDIILMSHVIEHFSPKDLLEFMDRYLDLLNSGGDLIIATPLMSSYFYDDFDHIKPYQPAGILSVFGNENSQVQYHSRHKLKLADLWFRRSYYRISYYRSRYFPSIMGRVGTMLEFFSALLSFVFIGRLGYVDGWMGVFKKL